MKKFRLFAYAALAMTGLSMVSCSEEDNTVYATPGSFGELTIDRTTIGTHQWFTISGSYTHGKDVTDEKLSISIDDGLSYDLTLSEDNKFSVQIARTQPGTHKVKVSATNIGIFHDGEVYQTVEKSIDVNVVASDIRCHFWGDSRETTIENLKHYTTLDQSNPNFLAITEQNMYGTVSYAKEVAADISTGFSNTTTDGNRVVTYNFTNDKLDKIDYICIPQSQQANSYVANMAIHVRNLKNEYNFVTYTYSTPNGALTTSEQAAVDACLGLLNGGATKDFDPTGEVGNLIQSNKVMLINTFTSKDGKTMGGIGTYYDNNEFQILIKFTPKPKS